MPAAETPRIVELAAPGQPSDRGATSLGLVMMLLASVVGTSVLVMTLAFAVEAGAPLGPATVLASIARLAAHALAGRALWRLDGRGARAVEIYVGVAVLHTVLLAALARETSVGAAWVVTLTGLAWPIAVGIAVATRRLGAMRALEAQGGERRTGAALIAIGGGFAVLPAACAVVLALSTRSNALLYLAAPLALPGLVGLSALLVARRLMRDGDVFDARTSLSHLAWASTTVGVLLGLVCVATAVGILALPAVVGTFVIAPWLVAMHAERAGDAPAPGDVERGGAALALGWLLLAHGLALVAHAPVAWLAPGDARDVEVVFVVSGWVAGSPLVHAALGAVELWAAIELIRGTPRARAATIAFVLASLAAIGTQWLGDVERLGGALDHAGARDAEHAAPLYAHTLYAAMQLVVPAVTAWVVLRRQTSVATAVVRARGE